MKTRQSYTRVIALTIILIIAVNSIVNSQGTDSRRTSGKKKQLYAGISLNPSMTSINNNDFSSSGTLGFKKGNSIGFAADAGYFFTDNIGASVGVGYGSFSTELTLDSYSTKYTTVDIENESYEMRISGKSINENQKISLFSIPVCFEFKSGGKFGFFVKAGISLNIPVGKTYEGNGEFTYDGYYPAYPVLLQNVSAYGFPSNLKTSSAGTLEIKSLFPALVASGGGSYSLSETLQLVLGIRFNKSLGNISGYEPDTNYKLTSKANELNSIMAGSSSAGIQAFGLTVGLKYYLK